MSCGIDLGSGSIKVVALQRGVRGLVVTGAARLSVPRRGAAEDRPALLARLLHSSFGSGNGRGAGVLGLTGREINVQVLQQPRMKPEEYRRMMGYELQERRGEDDSFYADYCTLRAPDAYFPQYLALVGVGRRDFVDQRLAAAGKAGVRVRDAVPNSIALFAAYRNAYPVEGGTVALLDVGAENMDLALVRGGNLIYARNVSTGSRLFDESIGAVSGVSPEEAERLKIRFGSLLPPSENAHEKEEAIRPGIRTAAGQLSGFIQSSLNHARAQLGDRDLTVDRLYLSGGGASLKGWPEYLESALKIPIDLLDPFRNLDTAKIEARGAEEIRSLPTEMAVAVGLAHLGLSPGQKTVLSLIPDGVKKKRALGRKWLFVGLEAAAVFGALLLLTIVASAREEDRTKLQTNYRNATKELNRSIGRMTGIEADQRETLARLDQLAALTGAPAALMDVVSELRKFGSRGLTVRRIQIRPARERAEPLRRCLFRHPQLGLVVGELLSRDEDRVGVRLDYPSEEAARASLGLKEEEAIPAFPAGDCAGLTIWDSAGNVVVVEGEVVADGVEAILEDLKVALTRRSSGQEAQIGALSVSSDRPGWRRFEIVVTCRPPYKR